MKKISYSSLKDWKECPFRFRLKNIDKLRSKSNLYSAYGKACHSIAESYVSSHSDGDTYDSLFYEAFSEEMNSLKREIGVIPDSEKIIAVDMIDTGADALNQLFTKMYEFYGEFTVIDTEFRIEYKYKNDHYEDLIFKGFIDLVIYSPKLNKICIIDYKTSTKGWSAYKKSNALTGYQLTLYKNFYSNIKDIPIDSIECFFILLKREQKSKIQFVKITTGKRKINNSLTLLDNALYNIKMERWIKNRLSCRFCSFYKTEHCSST